MMRQGHIFLLSFRHSLVPKTYTYIRHHPPTHTTLTSTYTQTRPSSGVDPSLTSFSSMQEKLPADSKVQRTRDQYINSISNRHVCLGSRREGSAIANFYPIFYASILSHGCHQSLKDTEGMRRAGRDSLQEPRCGDTCRLHVSFLSACASPSIQHRSNPHQERHPLPA